MANNQNLVIHTLVGTIFSVSFIDLNDIIKSALLAAVGATVSITVSLLLRYLINRFREKFKE